MTEYTMASPLGPLALTEADGKLTGLIFGGTVSEEAPPTPLLREAAAQLCAYFDGTLRGFHLPLSLGGTPFRHAVWEALLEIPYGETVSYGDIARRIGNPRAVRAVGQAVGCNPISIIVPCHRVIGSDGSLTGFGWGLSAKEFLLRLEGIL